MDTLAAGCFTNNLMASSSRTPCGDGRPRRIGIWTRPSASNWRRVRVLRLVDVASAPTVAATLLVWHLETGAGTRLVGAVEFQVTRTDHVVQTQVVQASETVSADLPGDLAAAAGRLLRRLALEGLMRVASER